MHPCRQPSYMKQSQVLAEEEEEEEEEEVFGTDLHLVQNFSPIH